jgi:hypothetical protein
MAIKSAGSSVNGRGRTPKSGSNSNSSKSNNTRGNSPMNSTSNYTSGSGQMSGGENTSSNQSAQTAQTGGSLGMISGPRMGMSQNSGGTSVSQNASANKLVGKSQNSGGTSFQTGVSQNASANKRAGKSQNSGGTSFQTGINQNALARKRAAEAAIQRQKQKGSSLSSYQTGVTPRTRQRNTHATAAESRRENENIVSSNLLNEFKQNVQNLETNIPRNIGSKISNILKSKVTVQKFVVLKNLLKNARKAAKAKVEREAAAEAARKKAQRNAEAQKAANQARKNAMKAQRNAEAQKAANQARKNAMKAQRNAEAQKAANQARKNATKAAAKRQKVVNTPVQQFRTAAQGASAVLKKILESKKQAALTKLNKHGVPEQNKVKLSKTIMNATTSNKVNAVITLINTNFPLKNNINTLSPIDLRRRAKELGFGQTVSELQQKYKGKLGIYRLREELKTFVNETPAKRKMSAVAKTPAKRKMSAVAKTPAKRKMSAVAKTPAERKMSAVAKTPAEKKMLATKGLLKVYMDKIARGKRKLITNEIQKEVLDYIVRRNLSSGRRLAVRKISTETFINMLLIMWLDGVHDKYIDMTFKDWLIAYESVFDPKNYESDPYFQKLQRAYFKEEPSQNKNRKLYILDGKKKLNILNGAISATIAVELAETPGKRTFFAETFINNLGFNGQRFISFSAGWEKNFKTIVLQKYIFLRKVNTIINPRRYNIESRTRGDRILLAVDQEYSGREERSLSGMISGSVSVSPLITYGQAFDPGSTMLPFGIVKDIEKIAIFTRTNTGSITPTEPRFISDASYYLEDFNIDIKINEESVIKIDFDSGKETGNSGLKLNDLSLELNVSAGNAKKKDGVKEKIAKYFGDALQYFIASQLTKASKRDRIKKIKEGGTRTYHYFLGSGDGMALFGYDFVCTKIFGNGAPNMVIDYSEGSIPIAHIINMDNTKFVLPEKKPVPSRTNLITESYRTQGGNNGITVNQT